MTWTAPDFDRVQPTRDLGERDSYEEWLDYHRATLLWKCSGLTEEQLKERAVPPSTLSLLGLVRHMLEVERWWFTVHAGDAEAEFPYSHDVDDGEFDVEAADAQADLEAFRREIEASKAAVEGKDLDLVVRSHGHDPRREANIRWIYLHMIEEYARHNGHADLLRERIDGSTGD